MRFPQTFIDDLRRQSDIVRVIQDYVSLKQKGTNWMACCPFHKEKTPSFSVSPAKEIFYCFGCHKGGSVFNFVMEIESVSFPEAIRIVAEKSGVTLPKLVDDSRYEARRQETDEIIRLNAWALEWWEQQLNSGAGEAAAAREYIAERQISEETRQIFRLGYAPDSWEALSLHLRQKGATQAQIEGSGLVVKKEEGGSYDRFRGRLIFPVFDVQGRPIAFGGRTLKEAEPAKYINSPETAVYVKGRNLFGLHLTKDEIRKQGFAILVEGFLDLIVPYQFGIRNVVASLGTALTANQVKLLTRFARKVVVNYDGDRAGIQAAKRAIEVLLTEDLDVKVLVLPDRADPDEFIRQFGATEYQRRRGEAQTHIQFVIDQAVLDRSLHRPAEKAAAVEEVLPYLRAVRSRIQKREYFDMAMDSLRIGDLVLRRELWQTVKSSTPESGAAHQTVLRRTLPKPTVAEQRLLELLVSDSESRRTILPRLEPPDYEDLVTAPIFRALLELNAEGTEIDFEVVRQRTEGDLLTEDILPALFANAPAFDEDGKPIHGHTGESCLAELRLAAVNRRIQEVASQMIEAERAGSPDERDKLALQQIELTRLRAALMPQALSADSSR
jgi:DNA primase